MFSGNDSVDHKRLHGQFFTTTNPFNVDPFHKWLKSVPGYDAETVLLEPFAGANNIVTMIQDLGYVNPWVCFDIEPVDSPDENASGVAVVERDTLTDFPSGFSVVVTNPPYLAKNSATRRDLDFPDTPYDDIYKLALDVMLANVGYVAAIIPESFLTQGLFHQRLQAVVSLTCKMFEDTEVPVCLALFVPAASKPDSSDFTLYAENRYLGTFQELRGHLECFVGEGLALRFNEPDGVIGLHAVDGQTGPTIRFVLGRDIPSDQVKPTGRSITRIACGLSMTQAKRVVAAANELLESRRTKTKDAFMTAFKGLRKDGRYRRRLDFAQARELLNLAARKEGLV